MTEHNLHHNPTKKKRNEADATALPPPFQYNVFLNRVFDDEGTNIDFEQDYKKHKALEFNAPLTLAIVAVLSVCIMSRCSFATLQWSQPTVFFYFSFSMYMVSVVTGFIVIFSRPATRSCIDGIPSLEMFHKWSLGLTSSIRYGQYWEDIYMLSFASSFALYMFGCTLIANCKEDQPMWDQQDCHPLAGNHAVPAYIFTMIAPLIPQILLKGATRWSILLSWIISLGLFNASHVYAGAPFITFFRINSTFALLMAVCYEHERMQMIVFLMKKQHDLAEAPIVSAVNELQKTPFGRVLLETIIAEIKPR